MFEGLLGSVLFAVLVPAGIALFRRFARRDPEVTAGGTVLRHGPALGVLGGICLALSAAILVGGLSTLPPGQLAAEVVILLGVGVGFGAAGAVALVSYATEAVRVDDLGVSSRRWPLSWRTVEWQRVGPIRFRALAGTLRVTGRRGGRVRVSALLSGADAVVDRLREVAETPGDHAALDRFARYREAYGLDRGNADGDRP